MTHGIYSTDNKFNVRENLRILGTTVQSSYPKYLQKPNSNKQIQQDNSNKTRQTPKMFIHSLNYLLKRHVITLLVDSNNRT
jgi:hypothetical protein